MTGTDRHILESERTATSFRSLLPLGILLLYGTIAGGAFTVSKLAITAGVHPIGYAFWQSAGSAIVMLTICVLRGHRLPVTPNYIWFCLVCGIAGIAVPAIVMFTAIAHLPAGVMGVIIATIPIFAFGISGALRFERIDWRRSIGVACGFAGAMLILLPRTSLLSPDAVPWAAFAFLTPFFYAVGGLYVGRSRPIDSSALTLTVGMLIASTLGLTPVVIITDSFYWFQTSLAIPDIAILVQIAISSICYLLFFELIRIAGAVYYSQVGYVVTMTGMFWAILILDEIYGGWIWLAVVLIFAGLGLVTGGPLQLRKGDSQGGA